MKRNGYAMMHAFSSCSNTAAGTSVRFGMIMDTALRVVSILIISLLSVIIISP